MTCSRRLPESVSMYEEKKSPPGNIKNLCMPYLLPCICHFPEGAEAASGGGGLRGGHREGGSGAVQAVQRL